MYLNSSGLSVCYGVRRFYFPQTIYIVIGIVSALVVVINSLVMISVLRNYRRLRQRIYVFIISQAAAEILAGLIFFADVMGLFFLPQQDPDNTGNNDPIYTTSFGQGKKYIRMKPSPEGFFWREILEGCKSAAVMLSVMNVILVTFAMYKRTTSMGRHHENFKGLNGVSAMDGTSFLPAFDTMLRVLSMDSYNDPRNYNRREKNIRSCRRPSQSSKLLDSQQQSKSPGEGKEELSEKKKGQCEERSSANVVRFSESATVRKVSTQEKTENPKYNASIARLLSSGRRVSQVFRSRSPSTVQEYVGRHGNSVMSKRATGCSLVSIWLIFLVLCVLPFALRRSREMNFICPEMCRTVEVIELNRLYDSMMNFDEGVNDSVSNRMPRPEPMKELMTRTNVAQDSTDDVSGALYASGGLTEREGNEWQTLERNGDEINDNNTAGRKTEGSLQHKNQEEFYQQVDSHGNSGTIPDDITYNSEFCIPNRCCGENNLVEGPENAAKSNSDDVRVIQSSCDSCSSMYYPHNKIYLLFNAVVIIMTWFWMIISAARLLYLRKHSSNVFVRCSALWRFMFMAAAFYCLTLAPYVASIILDFLTPSLASESPLWYTVPPHLSSNISSRVGGNWVGNTEVENGATVFEFSSTGTETNEYFSTSTDVKYLNQIYGVVSTFFILFNLAVSPSIYLIRLLGLRRIISAL